MSRNRRKQRRSPTSIAEEISKDNLSSGHIAFLKDITEIIKAETLFFSPMYLSFVGFIVAKPEFIKSADYFLKTMFIITFCVGIICAYSISSMLKIIETFRFIFNMDINTGNQFIKNLSEEDRNGLFDSFRQIGNALKWQRRFFKWTMNLIYITTISTMFNIYFKDVSYSAINYVVLYIYKHI